MAKHGPRGPYQTITDDMRHKVAALTAMEHRPYTVMSRSCLTRHMYDRILAEPGFDALLATKKQVCAQMLSGGEA